MGRPGAILITTMLFMAVTSAGSAELVAVSSLCTYDIYRTYINPKASGAPRNPACVPQRLMCNPAACILTAPVASSQALARVLPWGPRCRVGCVAEPARHLLCAQAI